MQISKLFLALGAGAVLSLSSPLLAQETAAQAKAREALRQKIAELNAEQAAAAPAAPVAPVAPTAPAAPAPPVVVAPQPPVVVAAPAAVPVVSAESTFTAVPAAPTNDATTAQAREALRRKMQELDAPVATATTTTAPGATYTPTPVTAAAAPGYQPIQVPASSLTGTKEARLATLLQQYKADQISPEQYHKQRAAIIAEP